MALGQSDSKRFAFSIWQEGVGQIFDATNDGGFKKQLFKDNWSNVPESWSSDGQWLMFTRMQAEKSQIWLLRRNQLQAHLLLESTSALSEARFSPNGKWVALTVTQGRIDEVYVSSIDLNKSTPVVRKDALMQISRGGGHSPEWGTDSDELFYVASDRTLMVVNRILSADPSPSLRRLFNLSTIGGPRYEYRFGGYSFDRRRNQFVVMLNNATR